MTVENLAQELYEAYSAEVGGVSISGLPLPTWGDFCTNPLYAKSYTAWLTTTSKAIALILAPKVLKESAPCPSST